jgi:hypothetical protein
VGNQAKDIEMYSRPLTASSKHKDRIIPKTGSKEVARTKKKGKR